MSTTILNSQQIRDITPDLEAVGLLSHATALPSQTLVYARDGLHLKLLTTNNFPELLHNVTERFELDEYECEIYYTDMDGFDEAMKRYQTLADHQNKVSAEQKKRRNASGQEAIDMLVDIIKHHENIAESDFIQEMLRLAFQSGSSDLHFQSEEGGVYVRLRKDGILQTVATFSHKARPKYLMKIKFMAGVKMNIDYLSQDGRFDFDAYRKGEPAHVDVRVSVLPGLRGGSIVMRFLDASKGLLTFEQIGMREAHIELLTSHMQRQSGLILVTGPTGSGKTSTVYSIISQLNTPRKKIITVEDPVEYELAGIEQSQIRSEKGYTFEEGLKGILRHDPDIIMVGEIRSLETAEMAINAALTGHLVISTLHTNSAVESIARLVNMGVKPYMLASATNLIIGQRLVRKIAKPVQQKADVGKDAYIREHITQIQKYHPELSVAYDGVVSVPEQTEGVYGEGYEGRVALIEMLEIDDIITQAIMAGKNSFELYQTAYEQGYLTLEHDGILKVLEGITSVQEMKRGVGV